MDRILNLIKKREEIGQKPSCKKGGNHNDHLEYMRLGELILGEITKLYKSGKLENLIELPVEIGERVWIIKKNSVIEDTVEDYDIWSLKAGADLRISLQNNRDYVVGVFGKTVFLTKEEAEQTLARMEGENE